MNRKLQPAYEPIKKIALLPVQRFSLENNIPIEYTESEGIGIVKVDFVLGASTRNQKQKCVAALVCNMLTEGTKKFPGNQLLEALDSFGAYIQPQLGADDTTVSLYCLSKYSMQCFTVVHSILTEALLEYDIINKHIIRSKQLIAVNEKKTKYMCRRAFKGLVFGENNVYGSPVKQEDYDNISRETLVSFYTDYVSSGLKKIYLSGDINQKVLENLRVFNDIQPYNLADNTIALSESLEQQIAIVPLKESIQSTIRIGKICINKYSEDFQGLAITNLVLGGFFGSRLMKNIREKLGLTYGIYSAIECNRDAACFFIEADLNNEKTEVALSEVKKELALLYESNISEEDLVVAKNYLIGSLLRSLDGPFASIDKYKMIHDYGLTYDYYDTYVNCIWAFSPEKLRSIAQKHLNRDSMSIVYAGNH
ncbi:MAG: insulinase family protein [Bacteroidia bacterium]|jgi:predicted Zn-dependent peptidase|nr:insulinase family protein [Bacteroidia bacterium]